MRGNARIVLQHRSLYDPSRRRPTMTTEAAHTHCNTLQHRSLYDPSRRSPAVSTGFPRRRIIKDHAPAKARRSGSVSPQPIPGCDHGIVGRDSGYNESCTATSLKRSHQLTTSRLAAKVRERIVRRDTMHDSRPTDLANRRRPARRAPWRSWRVPREARARADRADFRPRSPWRMRRLRHETRRSARRCYTGAPTLRY